MMGGYLVNAKKQNERKKIFFILSNLKLKNRNLYKFDKKIYRFMKTSFTFGS